jgi:hypothetical protein
MGEKQKRWLPKPSARRLFHDRTQRSDSLDRNHGREKEAILGAWRSEDSGNKDWRVREFPEFRRGRK